MNRGVVISTYFFSVGVKDIIFRLKSECTKLESFDADELTEIEYNDEFDILLFGKGCISSVKKEQNHFFRGMLVNHETSEIVLGQDGFSLWNKKNPTHEYRMFEGGFISIEWFRDCIKIQHDCFGLYPIFTYSDNEICIVSDSLFLISRAMKMIGKKVLLNSDVHTTRSWTYGLACSIMTKETIIQNVSYIPPCSNLIITTEKTDLICSENQLDVKNVFSTENMSYMETLIQAKEEMVALTTTVHQHTNAVFKLGLSGGLDSRIILALLFKLSSGLDKVYINSNIHPSRKEDYTIAKSLSETFNFKINQELPSNGQKPIRVKNPYGNFLLFNLGIFDMTYLYRSFWETPSTIEIGGHGAEIAKGTFSNVKLIRKISIWRPDKKIALRKELRRSLKPFGIRLGEKKSTQWHHLLYKSAIQNGRYLERTQLSLRPLMNRKLCALGLNTKHSEHSILKDLLILLSPELASQPFDELSKNIDEIQIKKILDESKKYNHIPKEQYTTYGKSELMKNGGINSFDSLTQLHTLDATDKKKALLDLMEDTWLKLTDKKVKRIYSKAYEMAKVRLENEASYLPSAGSPASKIIALGILFE